MAMCFFDRVVVRVAWRMKSNQPSPVDARYVFVLVGSSPLFLHRVPQEMLIHTTATTTTLCNFVFDLIFFPSDDCLDK